MHLRSGAFYRSGNQPAGDGRSRASTHESTARTPSGSAPIAEEVAYDSDSEISMASTSSANVANAGVDLQYDMQIRYERENALGAKIYKDQTDQYVVKVEDHPTAFDPAPWVNYQGDRYMGRDGAMYLIVADPEFVDSLGNVTTVADPGKIEGPPELTPAGYKLVNSIRTQRILVDDNTMAVYKREDSGTEFFYLRYNPTDYSLEADKVLYVYIQTALVSERMPTIFLDKFGFEWDLMLDSEVTGITYMGNPISRIAGIGVRTPGMGFTTPPSILRPAVSGSSIPLVRPTFSGSSMPLPRPVGSGARVSFFGEPLRPSVPPGFRPPGSIYSHAMSGHLAGRGPTRPPTPPITPLYHAPMGSTGFTPGRSPWTPSRNKTRPSNFQKWVKRFSGSGDPYDHLASFKQVARAEEVDDLHCLVEGFGLTLEGKALSWFQTLDPLAFRDFHALERDFISAFTKTGIKHSVSQLIYDFKQEEKESVRDCANRLRQYIARCPESEKPNAEKLVSIFLEGLLNKSLHANLYMKKHATLNECIYDAIDLDDNCDIYGKNKPITGSIAPSTRGSIDTERNHPAEAEVIAEMVMKKMNQMFKPPQKMQRCDICGGDHPTVQCLPKH